MDDIKASVLSSANDEQVTVNQRHLIDKILARYSAEFTVFRELLQNSNDAGATHVEIRFKLSKEPQSNSIFSFFQSSEKSILEIEYKNNGRPFEKQDWHRLKSIAEGNPDEQKIGFFGVGFYSLFSIAEEPMVLSGQECMVFYWKGDQLFTKKATVDRDPDWTSFYLKLREKMPCPSKTEFRKFLVASMAFTMNLLNVSVYFDDELEMTVSKGFSLLNEIKLDPSFKLSSPNNMFHLTSLNLQKVQFSFKTLQSETSMFMRILVLKTKNQIPTRISQEMERTLKKKPASTTTIHALWSTFDEFTATRTDLNSLEIFDQLVLDSNQQGKVFIGFQTHQTTGCNVHVASHFIPTVERENLDFVDPNLNFWNQELLSMVGLVCRVIYNQEMTSISEFYEQGIDMNEWLSNRAIHAMNAFTFSHSTPASIVGRVVEKYFNDSCNDPLLIWTSQGIQKASNVRLRDEITSNFIKKTPLTSPEISVNCPKFMRNLIESGIIQPVSINDVILETSRDFTLQEATSLMNWILEKRLPSRVSEKVLNVNVPEISFNLLKATRFIDHRVIPTDLPLPDYVLPWNLSKNFDLVQLETGFLNWKKLTMVEWINYYVKLPEFTSALGAEKLIQTVSRYYMHCKQIEKVELVSVLSLLNCIPTNKGILKPSETYFSANLFNDVAILKLEKPKSVSSSFLKALGVRETVDLQLVFDRLDTLNWDHVQLIKYLSSIKLEEGELKRLHATPIFPSQSKTSRKRAIDLYAPLDELKGLNLEFIDWPTKWRNSSPEAQFMYKLGLKSTLEIDFLLEFIASSCDSKKIELLEYFKTNFQVYSTNYQPSLVQMQFLPTISGELAKPLECFSNPEVQVLDLPVLKQDFVKFADILGVKSDPSTILLVNLLKQKPPSSSQATQVFSYYSTRCSNWSAREWSFIKSLEFIPVKIKDSDKYFRPSQVYFQGILNFLSVDFGIAGNQFLKLAGVALEPSPEEICGLILLNPSEFLQNCGHQVYLDLIKRIATNFSYFKNKNLIKEMSNSPFLPSLHLKDKVQLKTAKEVFLIDDSFLQQLFDPPSCPLDQTIEEMYEKLGSKWLSKCISEKFIYKEPLHSIKEADELKARINERADLLRFDGLRERSVSELSLNYAKIKQFQVLTSLDIQIERSFNGIQKKEKTSCCFDKETIIILQEFDFYDVATVVSNLVLKQPKLNDRLWISSLLSSSLDSLMRKGFPIDRILKLQRPCNSSTALGNTPSTASTHRTTPSTCTSTEPITANAGVNTGLLDKIQNSIRNSDWFNRNTQSTTQDRNRVDKILNDSLKMLQSTREGDIKAVIPPEQVTKPIQTHCFPVAAADLWYFDSINSIQVFIDKEISHESITKLIDSGSFEQFSLVLKRLASCFGISTSVINIYYNETGQTIAFNRSGSLFFNIKYFEKRDQVDTFAYWFMTFCHELAHNLVKEHDANHEFYMSAFAEKYLKVLFEILSDFR